MNPFYFGDSERPLFGVYTPAKGAASRGSVVLCYPFGAEYMRAHRAFRQLTHLLSRAGFDVLRFDYSNTGDSAGRSEEASMADWLDDVGTAIDEMKETTGHDDVVLVGLRLGAAIAATAATMRDDVRQLILWDPIPRGDPYVEALRQAAGPHTNPGHNGPGPGTIGVAGFPISPALLQEIGAVDLFQLIERIPAADVVVSESHHDYDELHRALRERRPEAELLLRPSPNHWMEGDAFGSALIPSVIIDGIVQQLTRRSEFVKEGGAQ